MWRIVIRIFPLVALSIIAAAILTVNMILLIFSDLMEQDLDQTAAQYSFLLTQYLDEQLPKQEKEQRLQRYLQIDNSNVLVKPLTDLPKLSPEKSARFMRGEVIGVYQVNGISIKTNFFYRIGDSNNMLMYKSLNDDLDAISTASNLFILSVILLVISLWSYRHWNELQQIAATTDCISKGDFSARTTLKKYASTYPISHRINEMARYIQRLVNGQRELIHSVSHELRTPITRLDFGLELLKKYSNDQELLNRIDDMISDVAELNKLVDELLQLATVGQQYRAKIQPFNLIKIIQHNIQLLQHSYPNILISTTFPNTTDMYWGDQRLIERLLNNLLSNAGKYAQHAIHISVTTALNDFYHIIVEDDGSGIPSEERERLFEPFYRLEDNWDKSIHGYGLGLAIVHKIVQVHQGEISIEDSSLGGAKFVTCLPSCYQ